MEHTTSLITGHSITWRIDGIDRKGRIRYRVDATTKDGSHLGTEHMTWGDLAALMDA